MSGSQKTLYDGTEYEKMKSQNLEIKAEIKVLGKDGE